jgi:hypothetical protein
VASYGDAALDDPWKPDLASDPSLGFAPPQVEKADAPLETRSDPSSINIYIVRLRS